MGISTHVYVHDLMEIAFMNAAKQTYFCGLKLGYYLNILTPEQKKLIHPRTLNSWKNEDFTKHVGYDPNAPIFRLKNETALLYSNKGAENILKSYGVVLACFQSALSSLKKYKSILRENKNRFIDAFIACKDFVSTKQFELLSGISYKTINRWLNDRKCEQSIFNLCTKQYPNQLSLHEQNCIAQALQCSSNGHLFLCDIWAKLLRNKQLSVKRTTFYKYAKQITKTLGLQKCKLKHVANKVIASKPLEILHVDTTIVRTLDGGRWYINIIYDNYSKAILGIKAMLSANSTEVAQNLKEVMAEYRLYDKPFKLYCDGGTENRGAFDVLLKDHGQIKKFVTSFSNGIFNNILEAFNSKFKRRWINLFDLTQHDTIPEQCHRFKQIFNDTPQALIGILSPNEVLQGLIPWKDIWPELKNNIDNAKSERLILNKLNCCFTSDQIPN